MSNTTIDAIVGEPEVLEDEVTARPASHSRPASRPIPRGSRLKQAATALQALQVQGRLGSRRAATGPRHPRSSTRSSTSIAALAPRFPHDAAYLEASVGRLPRAGRPRGFGVPDFLDSLVAFQPQRHRVDGIRHLVVFPMYTQNGSPDRHVEALVVEVDLARVHRRARGRRLRQQAVRDAAPRRLHARLRHELGGAVPRDGRDARDPDVHVGRDLPGPRGGALPPGRARGIRDHEARPARRRGVRCSTTRSSPSGRS